MKYLIMLIVFINIIYAQTPTDVINQQIKDFEQKRTSVDKFFWWRTGAWSGGASSLGWAAIRGGVASGINETYNQFEYNKSGVDYSKILENSGQGFLIGGSIGLSGKFGNTIIRPSGVIGRPVNEPLKTWKFPAEMGAGVSGAIVPNLKSNNNE